MLFIGDSGTGKTGALASLVCAGYKLRIIDLDNGLDILKSYLTDPGSPYAKIIAEKKIDLDSAVRFKTITEHMRSVNGRIVPKSATVWTNTMNTLQEWKESAEDGGETLGKPRDWDRDTIVVIDSFTRLAGAAYYFIQQLNNRLGQDTIGFDYQRDIGQAQTQLERCLQMLYDESFSPNVIVISHITYRAPEGTDKDDKSIAKKGFPSAVGVALSPKMPTYFNNMVQSMTFGNGTATKHKIFTMPQGTIDLKSSAPLRVKKDYDLDWGLAEIFKAVRG